MKELLFALFSLFYLNGLSQTPVDVMENTLKVPRLGEEVFFCGFAEGDKVIFNFEEVNGKELKEIEILEWPSTSKFMDYKSKKIENKIFTIPRKGIYEFRFSNSAINIRVCRFKIQRIPANEMTLNFNTNVLWKTMHDTTYISTQEPYLIRSDTSIVIVSDQMTKVSSRNALNGNSNKGIADFILPAGTISWSYFIGANKEGQQAFAAAEEKFTNAAAASFSKIPGYGALGALALNGINYFSKLQGDDNVKYWFLTNWNSVQAFNAGVSFYHYKLGDVVSDASRMNTPLSGRIFIGLANDNILEPIEVIIKVSAVVVKNQWENRIVNKPFIQDKRVPYLEL